ncbi:UDP-glucuronosyl/UDP-glucosyltransferase protein, partial [Dioscorea alata]
MSSPHVILLPYPAQGHVIPFLELAYCLADSGFEVTFINTDHIHVRVTEAIAAVEHDTGMINLVSIPDGLESIEERSDLVKLSVRLSEVVPKSLEELIDKINKSGDGSRITSLIADENLSWIMPVAKTMGLHTVAFWPAAAATLSLLLSIPKLAEDGVIDDKRLAKIEEKVQLSPGMPSILPREFAWNGLFCDLKSQEALFNKLMDINKGLEFADMIICNSFHEIEAPTFKFMPKVLPIGPLLSGRRTGKAVGNFWPEDSSCISWLDKQNLSSTIYVAFGSFTVFDKLQFKELALGLELTGRPFLWVVRPDLTDQTCNAYPEGFRERIGSRGMIVGWSPQQRVLAHPSIACFVSHCGWNSTMEGVTNGVPFLCWPYFTDQFMNRTYICDVWKNGLEVSHGEDGVVSREEISGKIEKLLGDEKIKTKALALKDLAFKAISHGGSSFKNFNSLIETIK